MKTGSIAGASFGSWIGTPGSRVICLLGLVLLSASLLWRIADYLAYVHAVLFYPYQLDYGEGIVWQQMRDMVRGVAYAPLGVYPAIVYHYPPVFHLASAALAASAGIDELVAGRLVSIISSFATAGMIGLLTIKAAPRTIDPKVRCGCAILAGMLFLDCYPVIMWSVLMRVDMLAGALSMAGILFALRALEKPRWIYAASLMFVLSMYTKQISIAAPLATFSVLLFICPKVAVRGMVFAAITGLAALMWLVWATDGGFWDHIILYNINRLTPETLKNVLLVQIMGHIMFIALAVLGIIASWRYNHHGLASSRTLKTMRHALLENPHSTALLMVLLFVALKTIMLLGMMKSGSSYNYMIEWMSGIAVFAGLGLMPAVGVAVGRAGGRAHWPLAAACVGFIGVPAQILALPLDLPDAELATRTAASRAPIVNRIAASSLPVISDDMTLLIRAGKDVRWEAAITAELGQKGVYDQAAFARLVRARCFGFFVTEGTAGSMPFDARFNPPVAAAIAEAYPREERATKFILHFPPVGTRAGTICPHGEARWPKDVGE